jgi:hypothetical protein
MNIEGKTSIKWTWSLLWIGVNALSFPISIALAQLLIKYAGEVAGFSVFGIIIGFTQWLLLRKFLPGSGWWVLITTLALALGIVGVNLIGAVMYWEYISSIFAFIMLGLTVGILQTFLLRRYLKYVNLWLLVSVIGWGGGAGISMVRMPFPDFWAVVVDFLLLGLWYGLISAVFWVVQFCKVSKHEIIVGVPWVRITVAAIIVAIFVALPAWKLTSIPQLEQTAPPEFGVEPECPTLPPLLCENSQGECAKIVPFEPIEGEGYLNYPVNGETFENQYRSYLRLDLMMTVKYAAAKVACKTANWTYVEFHPVWLIDMSEEDGSIPGTSIGRPGHPAGTHVNGSDLDIAYFHTDVPKVWPWEKDDPALVKGNQAMVICKPTIFGMGVHHCRQMSKLLDPWRTALLIAYISENPAIRVIGVDGKVGPTIESALNQLVEAGWLAETERANITLAYEEENNGMGWYYHHFHHMHVSLDADY